MQFRVAKSLDILLQQINAAFPNRDKSSDGSIGDAAHASRSSDHNPWFTDNGIGIVTARDFTNDPESGMDSHILAMALIASKDERIKYVIDHGRICSGTGQNNPAWLWRAYNGLNKHDHHVHVSVKGGLENKKYYDDQSPWKIDMKLSAATTTVSMQPKPMLHSILRKGSKGNEVTELQKELNRHGATLTVDGNFGAVTEEAVKKYQSTHRLFVDGVVGRYTWETLEA